MYSGKAGTGLNLDRYEASLVVVDCSMAGMAVCRREDDGGEVKSIAADGRRRAAKSWFRWLLVARWSLIAGRKS